MQSIELFTGGGGLALGTHLAGFHHRILMEWNRNAVQTIRTNVQAASLPGIADWSVHQADIRQKVRQGFFEEFASGDIDLVAGGVPCQPFSVGGKHKAYNDNRDMFPDFVKVIEQVKPKAFIAENVKGLTRTTFASYFEYVKLRLTYPEISLEEDEDWVPHLHRLQKHHTGKPTSDLQYRVVAECLNAADYGVPQTRQRVFIVGFRADLDVAGGAGWSFPEPTHSKEALAQTMWQTGAYWERHRMKRADVLKYPDKAVLKKTASNAVLRKIAKTSITTQPWVTVRDVLHNMPEPTKHPSLIYDNHLLQEGARQYPGHDGSPLDLPSKTIKAGDHGVPGGENMLRRLDGSVRYFTVRESARIQTFPDCWKLEGAWGEAMRQIGNAVPIKLAHVVAESVAATLRSASGAPEVSTD